jgi:hypothetical protein
MKIQVTIECGRDEFERLASRVEFVRHTAWQVAAEFEEIETKRCRRHRFGRVLKVEEVKE